MVANYLGSNSKSHIKICFDETIDSGNLEIDGEKFNYNTLEPKLLKTNGIEKINKILGTNFPELDALHKYMLSNKTECASKFFDTIERIHFPKYIIDSIV
jgi:putative ATP-dependent endonuclease of the OLD family